MQSKGVSRWQLTPSSHSQVLQPPCKGRGRGDWLLGAVSGWVWMNLAGCTPGGRQRMEADGARDGIWGPGHEDTPSVAFPCGVMVPKASSPLRFSRGLSSPPDTDPSLP